MPIDITNKEEKQIALTGTQIEETLLQAHLSKDAIKKIEGLESSASEIDDTIENVIFTTVGKNLYDKSDKTLNYRVNTLTGVIQAENTYSVSGYIKIKSNTNYSAKYNTYYAFYDANKTFISGGNNGLSLVSPSNAAYIRIAASTSRMGASDIYKNQLEEGSTSTTFEEYKKVFTNTAILLSSEPTIITAALTGTADFVGRRSIQDAIDSISDASSQKRYEIRVSNGVYAATQQSHFDKNSYSQLAFIEGKEFVTVVGESKDKTIIMGYLPDNLGASFLYENYQPVVAGMNEFYIKNTTIIAKNCRYPIHIDYPSNFADSAAGIKECIVTHEGNTGDAAYWTSVNPIGLGTGSGQEVFIEGCEMSSVSMHNNINFTLPSKVTYKNCNIYGNSIVVSSLGSGKLCKFLLEDCSVSKTATVLFTTTNTSTTLKNQKADRISILLEMLSNEPLAVNNSLVTGSGLMVKSLLTGVTSTVRFDKTSTAFASIISSNLNSIAYENNYMRKVLNGYEYFDGGNGLSGYAVGSLGISSDSSIAKLGARLGDCSTTNKTLSMTINGTVYSVVFNTNLTSATNETIIALINAVIGSVATASEYIVGRDYYPLFKGNTIKKNVDTSEILAGMGIVYVSNGTIRKATNADGRIDGIALDNCIVGGKTRVITCGQIYTKNAGQRFAIQQSVNTATTYGTKLGMSATAGLFEIGATPSLLKGVGVNIVEII